MTEILSELGGRDISPGSQQATRDYDAFRLSEKGKKYLERNAEEVRRFAERLAAKAPVSKATRLAIKPQIIDDLLGLAPRRVDVPGPAPATSPGTAPPLPSVEGGDWDISFNAPTRQPLARVEPERSTGSGAALSPPPPLRRGYGVTGSWEAPSAGASFSDRLLTPPAAPPGASPSPAPPGPRSRGYGVSGSWGAPVGPTFSDRLLMPPAAPAGPLGMASTQRELPVELPVETLPRLPQSVNRRFATALIRQAMNELFPGAPDLLIIRDEVKVAQIDRRVRELYWKRPTSGPPQRLKFYGPLER